MSSHDELGLKVQRVRAALAQVRGQAEFGGVTVEVDADRQLTNLHLTDSALDNGPAHLSALISKTYRDAVANIAPGFVP